MLKRIQPQMVRIKQREQGAHVWMNNNFVFKPPRLILTRYINHHNTNNEGHAIFSNFQDVLILKSPNTHHKQTTYYNITRGYIEAQPPNKLVHILIKNLVWPFLLMFPKNPYP